MIRICKLSQRGILTESNAPATAEDSNRARIIFSMTEKKGGAPEFLFPPFEFCPTLLAKYKWCGKGLSYLGLPLMNTSMCSNHEHLRGKKKR